MTSRNFAAAFAFAFACAFAFSLTACERHGAAQTGEAKIKRGAYLTSVMVCGDCHTPGYFLGKPDESLHLAGSDVGFFIPNLGYFYGRNLTPDDETGLGTWSADDIVKALRTGVRP